MDEETLRKEFEEVAYREGFNLQRDYIDPDLYSSLETERAFRLWLESSRRADKRNAGRINELEAALTEIALYAHDNSTGPADLDHLWEIRRIAYDAL